MPPSEHSQEVQVGFKGWTAKIVGPCAGFVFMSIIIGIFLWYHNEQSLTYHHLVVKATQLNTKSIVQKLDTQTCILSMTAEEKDKFRSVGDFKRAISSWCPWIIGDSP